eukprot:scaffold766_cov167-Ochromonas_danica.AAC.4
MSCHKCIQYEPIYHTLSQELLSPIELSEDLGKDTTTTITTTKQKQKKEKKSLIIPFARANVDELKSWAAELGVMELPALVFIKKHRPILYRGLHTIPSIKQFLMKMTSPTPVQTLKSVEEVKTFLTSRKEEQFALSTIMTIGFFSDHKEVEEDDYEEFMEIAQELQSNEDLYFGIVTDRRVAQWFKTNKTIDRTPSILLEGEDSRHTINLDELYGEQQGLKGWITSRSIPLVGKINGRNFALYEKVQKPMLLLFLDLTDEYQSSQPGRVLGGRSGGILNEVLVEELRAVAKEHRDRLLFGYLDGTLYEDQMKALGLFGGKERLPSLAFNTRDGLQLPFPEELPINQDTLLQFCADFISGKLRTKADLRAMAARALQRAVPINTKNTVTRQARRASPEVVQGVSEQFGDGKLGDEAIVQVTAQNFEDVVMAEDKDVILLLHAKECASCSHFAVYFKRMALRFKDLAIPSLVVARMDVTDEAPPAHYHMMVGPLPLMIMVPAGKKQAPWTFFSGVGKVQQMMKWAQAHAGIPFQLPNLPHLSEKDRQLYKQQVREREEALEKKRLEEARAMEEEERAQAELKARHHTQQQASFTSSSKSVDQKGENSPLEHEQRTSEEVGEEYEEEEENVWFDAPSALNVPTEHDEF